MRKSIGVVITGLVVATLFAPGATAAGKKQVVEGSVAIPHPNPSDETCITGNHRRARLFTNYLFPNGVNGYEFEIDPKTAGKKFKLEVTGGEGVDIDISFYFDMGSTDDPAGAPSNVPFEERGEGGESGKVPPGYTIGLVCMYAGSNATFEYTAG